MSLASSNFRLGYEILNVEARAQITLSPLYEMSFMSSVVNNLNIEYELLWLGFEDGYARKYRRPNSKPRFAAFVSFCLHVSCILCTKIKTWLIELTVSYLK